MWFDWEQEAKFFNESLNNGIIKLLAGNSLSEKEFVLNSNFLNVYITVLDKLKEIEQQIKRSQ